MSDEYNAVLTIGGNLPEELAPELLRLMNDEIYVECDQLTLDNMAAELTDGVQLEQVSYGNPEEVVKFCLNNRLHFRREREPAHGDDAIIYTWTPTHGGHLTYQDSEGQIVVRVTDVVEHMNRGTIQHFLAQQQPPEIPPLVIVKGGDESTNNCDPLD